MRDKISNSGKCRRAAGLLVAAATATVLASSQQALGQRILGLDVSRWQGTISQTTWNNIYNIENRQFVFIRSSRGGTTGIDERQGGYTKPIPEREYWHSQRYDDPYFIQNVNRATAAGLFVGSYHFSRPDIIETTQNYDGSPAGVRNTGTDEANHFLQMAGPFMRPGYLLPVHDFEAGAGVRTSNQMAQFSIDFSNRIYEVMQIRPAIYLNGNYANILQGASLSLRNQLAQPPASSPSVVSPAYYQIWTARWPNQSNPDSIPVQTAHPKDTVSHIYGPWDDYGTEHPWHFWQYASTGRLQSFNNGNSNLDFNVSQGDIEWLKDQLVPAVWWNNSSGDWSTLANWNSGQTPIPPPQMPGQLTPAATGPLPTPRLPGAAGSGPTSGQHDTVILERPNANITVTVSTGTHNIRKLYMRETLNIIGGTLIINYDPTYFSDTVNYPAALRSGPISAQFSGPVTLGGTGALSVHTLQVDSTRTFTLAGGTLTFNKINLMPHASNPAKIAITGNVNINPLNDATAIIATGAGSGSGGSVDLGGGNRTIVVGDGGADEDFRVNVPITSGSLTKAGAGTMVMGATNTYTGITTIQDGILRVTGNNQLGNTGVETLMTVLTGGSGGSGHGGTLQLTNNVNYNLPLILGGGGVNGVSITAPGNTGALHSLSGSNTWAGTIWLAGTGTNGTDPLINQVGAAEGATLVLSGVIQDVIGVTATLAKSGPGDVVLTGTSPNTYGQLTRVYGGRLIIEKDGALGAAGSNLAATGNTFQLANSDSTIAFRAPSGSPGFAYNTNEWIFTDGAGNNGLGQLDNLGGNNTFAGKIGLGGPSVSSVVQSYLGVAAGSLEIQGGIYTRGASGVRNIHKSGVGTLIIAGDSGPAPTNTAAGSLTNSTFNVNAGTVVLKGTSSNTANIPGVTNWNVAPGAILALGKTNAAGSSNIHLANGTLRTDAGLTSAASITLGGGILDSQGHNSTFTGSISGSSGLAKTGTGSITLAGPVNGITGGPLTINAGTLAVAPNGGPSGVMKVSSLSIDPNARLDLNDNDLIVDYTGTSPYAELMTLVTQGFSSTVDPGKTGIVSSTSQAQGGDTILALVDNADLATPLSSWAGHAIDVDTVFGKYTFFGDVNLDGQVTGDDFALAVSNLGMTGAHWIHGDVNFSGAVTGDDITIIVSNLGKGVGNPLGSSSFIPEPAGLGALVLAGMLFRRSRPARR